ncbi:MAG: AAA family ATPase [Selenomonas sp.]|uniref:AAA family ATPase n=1 Tax=Selenomonas sp. TaxID=2053611 RepID=UPI0025D3D2A0|nr:AAA family ATPase [Selenomonas sp.]MCR5757744.1 AAA family ATPase [Selenomonas sp.]
MAPRVQSSIILSVFSTAAGSGKTLTAINIAADMARQGYSVCLLDLDLQFGDVAHYLGLPQTVTMAEAQVAIEQNPEIFDVNGYLARYTHRDVQFSVLLPPVKLEDAYRMDVSFLEQMVRSLGGFDFIVLDLTPVFNILNMVMLDLSTLIIYLGVVDTLPAIKNYKMGYDTLRRFNYDKSKIKLVENYDKKQKVVNIQNIERLLDEKFYFRLPYDPKAVQASIQRKCPVVLLEEDYPLKKRYRQISELYSRDKNQQVKKEESGEGFFRRLYHKWG